MKCCKFSDLPEDTIDKVFNDVYEGNRDQDMYSHIVGYYIGEYEEAVENNDRPEQYPEEDINTYRVLRDFFVDAGCEIGE